MRVSVVPAPEWLTLHEGYFPLGPDAGVRGPAGVAELAREVLGCNGSGAEVELLVVDDGTLGAEGYRLRVGPDGVRASAAGETGLRWAVQTLRQLLDGDRLPCLEIVDRPRYPWRGSLLDVARWCHPLPFLYEYVDLLALHKFNTLHLHLTDDQGWRFEVLRYPRLTAVGGFRDCSPVGHARDGVVDSVPHGGFYTQRELRDLVAYGLRRGVRIMPEVDAPGHMQAAISAYPWLGNDPARQLPVRDQWGISGHVLNVSDAAVGFVRDVLDELTDVFPFGYTHIGGDEVPTGEWATNSVARERIAAAGLAGPERLVGWWAAQLSAHLATLGRRAGVWDELLDSGVPDGATVFAWRNSEKVAQSVRTGHETVAAPQEYTYFDWAEGDGPDEPLAIRGTLPLAKVHGYQPPVGVLGVQGQLWSEYLPTPELVRWRAFPRLAALAEVAWCAERPDYVDFHQRLTSHLPRLAALGVGYRPLDPTG